MKCAQIHPNLAAFVVGGLEPEEAAEVEGYLTYCPGCRDEQAKPKCCSTSHQRPVTTALCSSPRNMSIKSLLLAKRRP
jgi:anti-sigma factor RsiW